MSALGPTTSARPVSTQVGLGRHSRSPLRRKTHSSRKHRLRHRCRTTTHRPPRYVTPQQKHSTPWHVYILPAYRPISHRTSPHAPTPRHSYCQPDVHTVHGCPANTIHRGEATPSVTALPAFGLSLALSVRPASYIVPTAPSRRQGHRNRSFPAMRRRRCHLSYRLRVSVVLPFHDRRR